MVGAVGQEVTEQAINVVSLGATYALLALGLAMVFNICGLINFAHGELVTIAAYTLYFGDRAGLSLAITAPLAVVAAGVVAFLMERVAFRPLRGRSFATLLFSSFAVSLIIQNAFLALVSPRQKGVALPEVFNKAVHLGSFSFSVVQMLTVATSVAALVALVLFVHRSKQGLGMLAASQDFATTRLMGVRANRVISLAFIVSGVLAGIAAIFIVARRGTVEPFMGFTPVLKAFIAVVLGGMGSLVGVVVGAFLLAGLEVTLDASLPSSILPFRDAVAFGVVIVILYFRPQGVLSSSQEVSA